MGYTTEFEGRFNLEPVLRPEHAEYLKAFSGSRRMRRSAPLVEALPDARRIAVGLPVGEEGGYYVGSFDDGNSGQGHWKTPDETILDYNNEPKGQHGLWCKWVPTEDLSAIEWNGVEKFYYYTDWLRYLIHHFLDPWGYVLNGRVEYWGESHNDHGFLEVTNNIVAQIPTPDPRPGEDDECHYF